MKQIDIKTITVVLFFAFINISHCLSQDLKPGVKEMINSLYPKANIVGWDSPRKRYEEVDIICNCSEFSGMMSLTVDSNANIMIKTFYYNSLEPLPNSVLNFIKTDTSQTVKIEKRDVRKSINYKGDISYTIIMYEGDKVYSIELKSTGEIISKKLIPKLRE
jgi:hypothetical protein